MQWATVAKQDDVADRAVADQVIEKPRPFLRAAAKINRVANSPKCAIAAIEIDPKHGVTACRESRTEALEKSRRQALQKKKAATGQCRVGAGDRHALCQPVT